MKKANKLAKHTRGAVVKLWTREHGDYGHPSLLLLPPGEYGETLEVEFQRNCVQESDHLYHSTIVEARALFSAYSWCDVGQYAYGTCYAAHFGRMYPNQLDRAATIARTVNAWEGVSHGDDLVRWVEALRDAGVPVEIRYDGEACDHYTVADNLRGKSGDFWYSPEVSLKLADYIRKDAEERIRYAKAA